MKDHFEDSFERIMAAEEKGTYRNYKPFAPRRPRWRLG
jgi:hypothetical protein